MNIIKTTIHTLAIATLIGGFSSCADYLDVSKELSKNLDKEEVFSNATYLRGWYGEIYTAMPNYSETGLDIQNGGGFYNSWAILSGELVCAHPNVLKFGQNTYTASASDFHRWATCYKAIRQAMIFLDRAPESLGNPKDNNYIGPDDMLRMRADVTYLLAYNYYLLFELYGPTPIVSDIADPEQSEIDYERASVDEMVNYIDGLLSEIIEGKYRDALPETLKKSEATGEDYNHKNENYNLNEILRPTKAAALALRARLWVYAASPLFNGRYEEALKVTNKDGKRLFPDYDAQKWQTAKKHLEALLSFADSRGMHLYKSEDNDPNKSVYELFQYYNDEIIWANGNNDYKATGSSMEARTTPGGGGLSNSMGNVGFYQEMIDNFFTKDGLDISEDVANYKETGFTDLKNVCSGKGHVDKQIFNMYVNREPRFYAAVTYEGKSWHLYKNDTFKDYGAYFSKGGAAYRDQTMHARTGYLLYKFNNRSILEDNSFNKNFARPWIYFRLADFYLYYAEVCNEIEPSDPNIITYLDKVRERAGIPGYKQLSEDGTKNIIGDQEKQREAIHRERIIEMLGEGNYYFDIHRWMKAGWSKDEKGNMIKDNENKSLIRTGMDISQKAATFDANGIATSFEKKVGEGSYYNRIVVDRFPWSKAMLLYPVPYTELQKSKLIVQNPLW